MTGSVRLTTAAMAGLTAFALASPVAAQERYSVSDNHVAIYNVAGAVHVVGTSGGSVTVDVTRGGSDAGSLSVEVDEIDGRQTLRVIYPDDEIVYEGPGRSTTQFRVRPDGTWGGDSGWFGRGDRVQVSTRGSGLRAHADLRIGVPRGQRVDVYLAVGRITAENVDGRVMLDTHSGRVDATNMSGNLYVDTGSGSVQIAGMQGDLMVDTGSGSVRVTDVRASAVGIDTGSGSVVAEGVAADRIVIDTGSGGIDLLRSSGREVSLDTGSGSVEAELSGRIGDLEVDTGSGSVTLRLPQTLSARLEVETGSGGIDVDFPVNVTRRARDELRGTIGDGGGRITVDTGSGSVRIRQL